MLGETIRETSTVRAILIRSLYGADSLAPRRRGMAMLASGGTTPPDAPRTRKTQTNQAVLGAPSGAGPRSSRPPRRH